MIYIAESLASSGRLLNRQVVFGHDADYTYYLDTLKRGKPTTG